MVGIAAALSLQDAGYSVMLIDRDAPGAGCSFGNAGVIANSFVLPLSSISNVLGAPRMLLDRTAPLSLPWRHAAHYAPWLWRFALNALPRNRRYSTDRLVELNSEALPAWKRLLPPEVFSMFFMERGMLDVVAAGRPDANLAANVAALRAEGVPVDLLSARQVAELEPLLEGKVSSGAFHSNVAQVINPALLSQALLERFTARGGLITRMSVVSLKPVAGQVEILGVGQSAHAKNALISAGWWSPELLAPFGLKAPLRAERGYHVTLPHVTSSFSRPISFHEESFLATPMVGGLRLAGTVELAPPDAAPDWRRAENLLAGARRYLADCDERDQRRWVGARPSFADSLPAIGQVPGAPNIFYSFGHQHLGLTWAAASAERLRHLTRHGESPKNRPYSLSRFGGAAVRRAA